MTVPTPFILFAGSPDLAVPSLRALAAAGTVAAVLTNPDAPTGRGRRLEASPVKAAALELGLPVLEPERLDGAARALVEALNPRPRLLVSFAYGRLFGPRFLSLFDWGGWNVHPSLLPRWRGPSPLNAALVAGDPETGLTLQTLALGMDEGDILVQTRRPLDGSETAARLGQWAAETAPLALLEALDRLHSQGGGPLTGRPQEGPAVYCQLLTKDQGILDWCRPARELDGLIRGLNPWPGARTTWRGQPLSLWDSRLLEDASLPDAPPGTVLFVDKKSGPVVQTGRGRLVLRVLQSPGRRALDFREFLNGAPGFEGSRLGGDE